MQIGKTLPNKEVFIGLSDRASAPPPPLFEVLICYQNYTCKKGKKLTFLIVQFCLCTLLQLGT